MLDTQKKFVNFLSLNTEADFSYIFLDEIQRKQNAGLFLKSVYDRDLPYKFIVSGSGSLELKEEIHESLMGRKLLFEMSPVSLLEMINFLT